MYLDEFIKQTTDTIGRFLHGFPYPDGTAENKDDLIFDEVFIYTFYWKLYTIYL